jgi:hypothetical protein
LEFGFYSGKRFDSLLLAKESHLTFPKFPNPRKDYMIAPVELVNGSERHLGGRPTKRTPEGNRMLRRNVKIPFGSSLTPEITLTHGEP